MKIIDRKKDYYDFLVGTYGVDEKCVYVRNGVDVQAFIDYKIQSWTSTDSTLAKNMWKVFRKKPLVTPSYLLNTGLKPDDDDKMLPNSYNPFIYTWRGNDYKERELHEGYPYKSSIMNMIVGNSRYYFEVLRYLKKDGTLYYDMQWEKRELFGRVSPAPIYFDFSSCSKEALSNFNRAKEDIQERIIANSVIENPLLKNTFIPSVISPETIWVETENYISALNNEVAHDNMTNNEKILSHGFDLKTSFRNVK